MTKAETLEITDFPYSEYDEYGNDTYYEEKEGYWYRCEYDENSNQTYLENANGFWSERVYDKNDNQTYYLNSDLQWDMIIYDEHSDMIHFEDWRGSYWNIKMNIPMPYIL